MTDYGSPVPSIPLVRTGKYGKRAPQDLADGTKSAVNHEGVDARAAIGTPVHPVIGGVVVQTITGWVRGGHVGTSRGRGIIRPGGAGNVFVVRGDDGRDHVYAHLDSVAVRVDQRVGRSTVGGRSGRSGVFDPHVHYGLWIEYAPNRWRSIDPTLLLQWDGDKFGELDKIKGSAPRPATPMEDDVALTPEQAAALDWLNLDRRKLIDARLWQLGQLAERIGVIDELGRDVNRLDWIGERQEQADLDSFRLTDLHARVGVLDRIGLIDGGRGVDLSTEDVQALAAMLTEALPAANGRALVDALAAQLSAPRPESA